MISTSPKLDDSLGEQGVAAAREILQAAVVERNVPRPRLGDWWQDVFARVGTFVASLLNLDSATVRVLLMAVAWGVIGVTSLVALWFLWGWWRRRGAALQTPEYERIGGRSKRLGMDARSWQERLEEALQRRDVSAALEALWCVVAARLWTTPAASGVRGEGPDADSGLGRGWSGRRLLEAAGGLRLRLAPTVRGLERITYSEELATLDEIERLRAAVDDVLPAEPEPSSPRRPGSGTQGS